MQNFAPCINHWIQTHKFLPLQLHITWNWKLSDYSNYAFFVNIEHFDVRVCIRYLVHYSRCTFLCLNNTKDVTLQIIFFIYGLFLLIFDKFSHRIVKKKIEYRKKRLTPLLDSSCTSRNDPSLWSNSCLFWHYKSCLSAHLRAAESLLSWEVWVQFFRISTFMSQQKLLHFLVEAWISAPQDLISKGPHLSLVFFSSVTCSGLLQLLPISYFVFSAFRNWSLSFLKFLF